jgi:hypothetical protein
MTHAWLSPREAGATETAQRLSVFMPTAALRDVDGVAHVILYRGRKSAQILAARPDIQTTGLKGGTPARPSRRLRSWKRANLNPLLACKVKETISTYGFHI